MHLGIAFYLNLNSYFLLKFRTKRFHSDEYVFAFYTFFTDLFWLFWIDMANYLRLYYNRQAARHRL